VWLLLADSGKRGGMRGGMHGGKHGGSLQACPQADTTSRHAKCRGME
jgi:hypothetical protein